MKLKKLLLLTLMASYITGYTHICAHNQIKPDDKLDSQTYVLWKKNEPQKIEQLKAYIRKCLACDIDDKTLETEIKRAIGIYKSRITQTIHSVAKKIAAKYMPKNKAIKINSKKNKTVKSSNTMTKNMSNHELKKRLYEIQHQIAQLSKKKYATLTMIKLGCKSNKVKVSLHKTNKTLEQLYFERDNILELAKQNGPKSIREILQLTQKFDIIIATNEKYYQEELKELV